MPNWTEDQSIAITTKDKNLLVSAAAGSGKTTVLVERIIRIILRDKVDLERILVVTFTKSAAEEMKTRINKALVQELNNLSNERQFIYKQLNILSSSNISTLHSFCLYIIKRYYHLIDLDPGLSVGNDSQTNILKHKSLEELMEDEYDKGDKKFIELLDMYCKSRNDDNLRKIIIQTYNFLMNRPYPQKWSKEAIDSFDFDITTFNKSKYYEVYKYTIYEKLSAAKKALLISLDYCDNTENYSTVEKNILAEINQNEVLINELEIGLEEFYKSCKKVKFDRLTVKCDDPIIKDMIVSNRNYSKKIIQGIVEEILINSPKTMIDNLHEMKPVIEYLFQLVYEFELKYKENKLENNLMDFNDIEHYCLRILENDQVVNELKMYFKYIYIDEYQDSNAIQETIIEKIRNINNIFMVGDVKQSIYRFRLADPTLFISKYNKFKNNRQDCMLINLNNNFRSRKEIIKTTNMIFKEIMCKYVGEINYDSEAELKQGISYPNNTDAKVKIALINTDKDTYGNVDDDIIALSNKEAEAHYIAKEIMALTNKQIYDCKAGKFREIQYKDIVILLRTNKEWSNVYSNIFMEYGIPVFSETEMGYFNTLEIKILLNILKLIDNRQQDVPLISVMRSPIFNFTIEEMINIRINFSEGSYYNALCRYIIDKEDDLSIKVNNMISRFDSWKKESTYMSIDDFLWNIVIDTGYYYYLGAMPGGIQRQANIRVLMDRAKQFSSSSFSGLFNFINFIEKLKDTKSDLSTAKTIGSLDNVVRIMSIHKSKGLEFPVVFIGGMGKKINMSDISQDIILHKDLGICPTYVSTNQNRYCDSIYKIIAKEKVKLETLSEEMRVLYVAMTRAKNMLYLVGNKGITDKKLTNWEKDINEYKLSTAQNYLDWIMPVFLNNYKENWEEDNGRIKYYNSNYWELKIFNLNNLNKLKNNEEIIDLKDHLNNIENNSNQLSINNKLNWKYKFDEATKLPVKIAVTELKNKFNKDCIKVPNLSQAPSFIDNKKLLSAAEKGSVVHFVLQHLDLKEFMNITKNEEINKEIKTQIESMYYKELISEVEKECIDINRISNFLLSNLGKRLLKSQEVYREKPFNLQLQTNEVVPNSSYIDSILVQGIIDCFFIENNEYILIDYKNDFYQDDNHLKSLINNYSNQINIYKKALKMLYNKEVKESYLYMFHGNKAVLV